MICKKCGSTIPESSIVCDVCGEKIENNNYNGNNKKKPNIALIIIIVILIFVIGIIALIVGVFSLVFNSSKQMVCKSEEGNITILYNDKKVSGYKAYGISYNLKEQQDLSEKIGIDQYLKEFNDWFENNTSGTCTINGKPVSASNTNSSNTKNVKGQYSREVFSDNTFDYKNDSSTAVFKFYSDSTFEVNYTNGPTYKGTYEIYNGLYITSKALDIEDDTSIKDNYQLAAEIKTVSNKMMDTTEAILNTYLIWIETNDGILQPFLIKYDTTTDTGIIVNVYARSQGTIAKR